MSRLDQVTNSGRSDQGADDLPPSAGTRALWIVRGMLYVTIAVVIMPASGGGREQW